MKKTLAGLGSAVALVAPICGAGNATAADKYEHPTTYSNAMVGYTMKSHHLSEGEAKKFLADQASQQASLASLEKNGVPTNGAFFDGANKLVVITDAAHGATVRAKGLQHRTGKGQHELATEAATIAKATSGRRYVAAIDIDLPTGKVITTITKDAPAGAAAAITALSTDAVVRTGAANVLQNDVLGGQDMNMPHTADSMMSICSNGFMAKMPSGNTVMLTAGHCVEDTSLPVQDASRTHIGTILNTRFHTGTASRDMGLVDIDSDDTPYGWVDTRGADGYYAVKGMSKNAVGTQLCKSGRTTGWTCGTITSYGTTVNYGNGTTVSNLMTTTVCTQNGDSGGAYIGVGDLAQGMTSGGPLEQNCGGYNTGWNSKGTSYVQPVVDAASYYGATLILGN